MLSSEINSLFHQNSSILKIINYQIRSLSISKNCRLEINQHNIRILFVFNIFISIKNSEMKSQNKRIP